MRQPTNTATQILRCMVCSLLENGFNKQDIAVALARLTDESNRDGWQKALETRQRARGQPVESLARDMAAPAGQTPAA
jgi:hypothetical protein